MDNSEYFEEDFTQSFTHSLLTRSLIH